MEAAEAAGAAAPEAAGAAAEASAAGAGAGAAAGAGAGAGASGFLPQADRATAANRAARATVFFISVPFLKMENFPENLSPHHQKAQGQKNRKDSSSFCSAFDYRA